ncbi:hypothetical protein [Ureibacillus acetophenoni]|uniref:Uncharacterized protein n=1 Tax=Ureibacillus acetophenoni TaxID=614649 RepID=A0A285U7B0_9BACL|nr:hypothetical protein [Ureibacillus acetophenoni]SOC37722.1 hypothetical protein SAMN05877842_103328 [Ureibacillus acetophenoni]
MGYFFWAVIGIIAVAGIVTDYLHKQSKLKIEATRQEIELEKLRQENFMLETEKLRLEIEQSRQRLSLDYNHKDPNEKESKS